MILSEIYSIAKYANIPKWMDNVFEANMVRLFQYITHSRQPIKTFPINLFGAKEGINESQTGLKLVKRLTQVLNHAQ